MSEFLYRCRNCLAEGKERTFRTKSGYLTHMIEYHGAKADDLVTVVTTKKEPHETEH